MISTRVYEQEKTLWRFQNYKHTWSSWTRGYTRKTLVMKVELHQTRTPRVMARFRYKFAVTRDYDVKDCMCSRIEAEFSCHATQPDTARTTHTLPSFRHSQKSHQHVVYVAGNLCSGHWHSDMTKPWADLHFTFWVEYEDGWLSSGLLRRVDCYTFIDVSDVLVVSIIRAMAIINYKLRDSKHLRNVENVYQTTRRENL